MISIAVKIESSTQLLNAAVALTYSLPACQHFFLNEMSVTPAAVSKLCTTLTSSEAIYSSFSSFILSDICLIFATN